MFDLPPRLSLMDFPYRSFNGYLDRRFLINGVFSVGSPFSKTSFSFFPFWGNLPMKSFLEMYLLYIFFFFLEVPQSL